MNSFANEITCFKKAPKFTTNNLFLSISNTYFQNIKVMNI